MHERDHLIRGRRPGDLFFRPRRRAVRRLRPALTAPLLFHQTYITASAALYAALGSVAVLALGATPLAVGLAGGLAFLTALTYAEGVLTVPGPGGSANLARHAFNELASFLVGWMAALAAIALIALAVVAAGAYLAYLWPELGEPPVSLLFAFGVIGLLLTVNVVGATGSVSLSLLFLGLDLLLQGLIVGVGMVWLGDLPRLLGPVLRDLTAEHLLSGAALAIIAYAGLEMAASLAEEARGLEGVLPRALLGAGLLALVLSTGIALIALGAFPFDSAGAGTAAFLAADDRAVLLLRLVQRFPAPASHFLAPAVVVLGAAQLIIAANVGLVGLARLAYSMGQYQQIPTALTALHPRFRTPYRALLVTTLVASLLVLTGDPLVISEVYAFGTLFVFGLAHLALMGLRRRQPYLPRPFRVPVNVQVRGLAVPVPAVVGLVGTAGLWLVGLWTHPYGRSGGLLWLALGLLLYLAYRRRRQLPLLATVRAPAV